MRAAYNWLHALLETLHLFYPGVRPAQNTMKICERRGDVRFAVVRFSGGWSCPVRVAWRLRVALVLGLVVLLAGSALWLHAYRQRERNRAALEEQRRATAAELARLNALYAARKAELDALGSRVKPQPLKPQHVDLPWPRNDTPNPNASTPIPSGSPPAETRATHQSAAR